MFAIVSVIQVDMHAAVPIWGGEGKGKHPAAKARSAALIDALRLQRVQVICQNAVWLFHVHLPALLFVGWCRKYIAWIIFKLIMRALAE